MKPYRVHDKTDPLVKTWNSIELGGEYIGENPEGRYLTQIDLKTECRLTKEML